jgi:hypothetical protein
LFDAVVLKLPFFGCFLAGGLLGRFAMINSRDGDVVGLPSKPETGAGDLRAALVGAVVEAAACYFQT